MRFLCKKIERSWSIYVDDYTLATDVTNINLKSSSSSINLKIINLIIRPVSGEETAWNNEDE